MPVIHLYTFFSRQIHGPFPQAWEYWGSGSWNWFVCKHTVTEAIELPSFCAKPRWLRSPWSEPSWTLMLNSGLCASSRNQQTWRISKLIKREKPLEESSKSERNIWYRTSGERKKREKTSLENGKNEDISEFEEKKWLEQLPGLL